MNEQLPIHAFKDEILQAVCSNAVTVITAETGAGKSTQVPQFLLEMGSTVMVTQPRRLAARTLAQRVASEQGQELGGVVGFRTAHERRDSYNTKCLFVTDGLAFVRELVGANKHEVLIIDEVHEWNLNVEVLIAWAKKQIERNARFKVVVMSATMDAQEVAKFFGPATPVISVPGRQFPIQDLVPDMPLPNKVATLLSMGRNVLVFQPGKSQIYQTIEDIQRCKLAGSPIILPLHGEMDPEEQSRCFQHYAGQPKCVVATNVAQTSITIDDIDAVVDSGIERRRELVDGIEGLYLKPISMADSMQRRGRAGRTREGIYIDYCDAKPEDRLQFPKAEILRCRLDQTVLRLAEAGLDAQELRFFHQPDVSEIHEAKRALKALGCMDESGEVTKIGHRVAKLPISVKYGRMIVEAERLGVVDDVLTAAAILEVGGITIHNGDWRRLVVGERESDIMAQLSIYRQAHSMKKDAFEGEGIRKKNFFRAKETRKHLAESLVGKIEEGKFRSSGNREHILRAICAGMVDHLYHGNFDAYTLGDGVYRQRAKESVVYGAEWIVGSPMDLEVPNRRWGGTILLKLVGMITKVDPSWLAEIAPQLVRTHRGHDAKFDLDSNTVMVITKVHFQDHLIKEEWVPDPNYDRYKAERLKIIAQEAREREELEQALSRNKSRISDLYSQHGMYAGANPVLSWSLRERLRDEWTKHYFWSVSVQELREYVAHTQAFIVEVERALAGEKPLPQVTQVKPVRMSVAPPLVPSTVGDLAEKWGGRVKTVSKK